MDTTDQIRAFIEKTFGKAVGVDDSLLDSGLLDSIGIFEVATFLESAFGITVEDEAIIPEHFETVTLIANFVNRKKANTAA